MLWPASGRLPWHENNMSYLEENYCHENCIHRHKKYMPVHSRQKTKNSFSVQTHSQSELIQCPNSFSVRTLSVSELFQYLNSFSLWTRGCMGGGWVHVVIRKGHVAPKAPSISDWKIASKERKYFHYMNEFILWKNIKTKLVAWPNMRLKIICFVHLVEYLPCKLQHFSVWDDLSWIMMQCKIIVQMIRPGTKNSGILINLFRQVWTAMLPFWQTRHPVW